MIIFDFFGIHCYFHMQTTLVPFLGEGPRLVAFSVGWVSTVPGNWSLIEPSFGPGFLAREGFVHLFISCPFLSSPVSLP